jgi:hypothetical protein
MMYNATGKDKDMQDLNRAVLELDNRLDTHRPASAAELKAAIGELETILDRLYREPRRDGTYETINMLEQKRANFLSEQKSKR